MSEDKKFDEYINKLFDEDSKVPAELRWEAMEFDFPKPSERKRIKALQVKGTLHFYCYFYLLLWHYTLQLAKKKKKKY